jgi:serine/threonine-protein kinase
MSERFGSYELLRPLGSGGYSDVYLARNIDAGPEAPLVALKRFRRSATASKGSLRKLEREIALGQRLLHPNLVRTFELAQLEGEYFATLEYVPGKSLREVLGAWGAPLPWGTACFIVSEAAKGLHFLHSMRKDSGEPDGWIHTDVSARNLLLGEDGQVKVTDFGLALPATFVPRSSGPHLVRTNMAPEQVLAQPATPRTDVFALGLVLSEALTGQRPHAAAEEEARRRAILEEPPLPPSQLRPEIPRSVDEVVVKALSKNPDGRFESAWALHEALEACRGVAGEALSVSALLRPTTSRDIVG